MAGGGGGFMHRVLTYLINELVVNGLANSPGFQRWAVRTNKRIEDASLFAARRKQNYKNFNEFFQSSKDQ
ncbi:hypothetical protein MKX01_002488 [Papaver californicum]|nr:hypothetical protein MKX01_002488 [Papaver californicum]